MYSDATTTLFEHPENGSKYKSGQRIILDVRGFYDGEPPIVRVLKPVDQCIKPPNKGKKNK
ncbi:MAG: hypothetical protein ACR2N2_01660 [Acidimicrobiia bacterium]